MRKVLFTVLFITLSSLPAFAQDNSRFEAINADNLDQLELLTTFGDGYLTDVEWSPDGTILAFSGAQGIWFYEADNLDNRQLLINHRVDQIEFLSDDELVFLDHEGIHTLNLDTEGVQSTGIKNLDEFIFSPFRRYVFDPAGRYIRVWDWSTKALIFEQELSNENDVNETIFTPDETGILVQQDLRERGFQWKYVDVTGSATAPTYMSLLTSDVVNLYPLGERHQLILFREDIPEMEVWNTDTLELEQIVELRSPYIDYFAEIDVHDNTLRMGVWNDLSNSDIGMHAYVWSLDTFDEIHYVNDGQLSKQMLPWFWAFHTDGEIVTVVDALGARVYTINMSAGAIMWEWQNYGSIGDFEFNPSGDQLVISPAYTLQVWDFQANEIRGLNLGNWGAAYIDDDHIITYEMVPQALLNSSTLETIQELESVGGIFRDWEPDDRYQILSFGRATFQIWDMLENRLIQRFEGHEDYIYDADFNSDQSLIASVSHDLTIRIWDTASGEQINQFDWYHNKTLPSIVEFSPDSKTLVIGGFDGVVQLLDLTTGQSSLLEPASGQITELRYINDGQRLFASTENNIYVWDTQNLRLQYSIGQLDLDWRYKIYVEDEFFAVIQYHHQQCEPFDNCLLFFNTQDGTVLHKIPDVSKFIFSDGKTLLAILRQDQIQLFGIPKK